MEFFLIGLAIIVPLAMLAIGASLIVNAIESIKQSMEEMRRNKNRLKP